MPDGIVAENISVRRFARFVLGEGLEKKRENLAEEIAKWLRRLPAQASVGVSFSGGIDSGSVFLVVHHVMLRLGLSPQRLKAFVLNGGDGPDVAQARAFLAATGLSMYLEEITIDRHTLDAGDPVSPPKGRCGSQARRLRSGGAFRQGACQRAGKLPARRAVPDR